MTVLVPRCYDAKTGQVATASDQSYVVYPYPYRNETRAFPSPAQAAANVAKAIATIPANSNPGVL